MKVKRQLFPFVFGLFMLAWACTENDDELFMNDPIVDVQVFNIDSLVKVNDTLKVVTDSLSGLTDTLKILNDSSTVLRDSVSALTVLIDGGQTDLEDQKTTLEGILSGFTTTITSLTKSDSILKVSSTHWTSVASTIESGRLLVSVITNAVNSRQITFTDSATVYNLPLSMTVDSSAFVLQVADMNFELTLGYERTQVLDEKERIEVEASGIKVLRHTFDSTSVNCATSSCIDNATVVKLYF